jgi:ribosome-binding factor A
MQRELALIMQRELQDPRLPVITSITRIKVADDLSMADVYVSIMGSPGQQTAGLNALMHSAGMMRSRLTKVLALRIAPYLRFHIDEQLKKEMAVLDLLHQVEAEREERDRQKQEPTEQQEDS